MANNDPISTGASMTWSMRNGDSVGNGIINVELKLDEL
ncbi:hypothetical protein SynSYN20_00283 [Synechococcus sp. SYN20]|nr:hypothetical protein SynSYN20_00283 [Synechococcus sp. SYN20]